MKLVVVLHKQGWPRDVSPMGYATDGGFPYHMQAISNLFDRTEVLMPVVEEGAPAGIGSLSGT